MYSGHSDSGQCTGTTAVPELSVNTAMSRHAPLHSQIFHRTAQLCPSHLQLGNLKLDFTFLKRFPYVSTDEGFLLGMIRNPTFIAFVSV